MAATADTKYIDWKRVFSPENKARTVKYCKIDRKNCCYIFSKHDVTFRKAAVLIPLCYDVLGRPSILYNLRSLNLSRNRGEISFPGGIMDLGDCNSPIETALRETEEELGLKRKKVEVWALLRDFKIIATAMEVTPVLGFVHGLKKIDPTKLKINPGEVDHAFTVTLEHLCDSRNWDEIEDEMEKISMPVYKNLNVKSDDNMVDLWGLTAMMTHLALLALLPHVYKRQISFLEPLPQTYPKL